VAKFVGHATMSALVLGTSLVMLAGNFGPQEMRLVWAGFIGTIVGVWGGKRPDVHLSGRHSASDAV